MPFKGHLEIVKRITTIVTLLCRVQTKNLDKSYRVFVQQFVYANLSLCRPQIELCLENIQIYKTILQLKAMEVELVRRNVNRDVVQWRSIVICCRRFDLRQTQLAVDSVKRTLHLCYVSFGNYNVLHIIMDVKFWMNIYASAVTSSPLGQALKLIHIDPPIDWLGLVGILLLNVSFTYFTLSALAEKSSRLS